MLGSGPRVTSGSRTSARTALVLATAPLGLHAGHAVAYRLAIADPTARAHELDATAHGWTAQLWQIAVVTAALGLLAGALGAARQPERSHPTLTWRGAALIQSGAYLAVEIGERLLSGHTDGPVLRLLAVGVALQLVVAAVQVALAVGAVVVARKLAGTARRAPRCAAAPPRASRQRSAVPAVAIGRIAPTRGPPIRLVTQ